MRILDSDHLSLLEWDNERGWTAYIARSKSLSQQVNAYARLRRHLDNYRQIPVLDFDESSAANFQRLRSACIRIGTMDLKIAAIAILILSGSTVCSTLKPQLVQRFEREVQAVARLSHPHIVAALDAQEDDGLHYLITEYVEGCDLDHLVKGQGPLKVDAAVRMIVQAARGLEYAHSKQVIHRDIKPANLLLSAEPDARIKLLDLGLARFNSEQAGNEPQATELTKTGMVMGTAAYMAPEQARNTKNADERLVAKAPDDRYPSMTEVIADLENFSRAVPRIVMPTATRLPMSPARRANSSRLGRLLGGSLAFVAVVILGVYLTRPSDDSIVPPVPTGNRVLSFNGHSSYVEIPSLVHDPTKSETLEAIVQLRTPRTSNIISWLGPEWMSIFVGGRGHWGVSRLVGGQSTLIESTTPAQVGSLVHLAATWNGKSLNLFVDGELVETTPLAFDLSVTQGGLYVGGVRGDLLPSGQNDRFFDGIIEAVRISDGVRYKETFGAPAMLNSDSDTLALHVFDAGQGQHVEDTSQHGHDGTIVDAEWIER